MTTLKLLDYIKNVASKNILINEKDDSILLQIPQGEFMMGDGEETNCPKHSVYLDTFYIGAYTITNRQYLRFVKETGHRLPDKSEWGYPVWSNGSFPEKYENHPVVCVSWHDALAYCKWAGLFLPTEAQWEKAARGPNMYRYPWGNEWNRNNCLNYMNKGAEHLCAVFEYSEGISGYGLYNTSGNVLEWCADYYDKDYYNFSPKNNPMGPEQGRYKVARGGGWGSSSSDCRSAARNDFNLPGERANFRGFRVAFTK